MASVRQPFAMTSTVRSPKRSYKCETAGSAMYASTIALGGKRDEGLAHQLHGRDRYTVTTRDQR